MKKFILGVFFDHSLKSGGNFQQSLNNILLASKLSSEEIEVKIITTKKENIKIFRSHGIVSTLYSPSIFSRLFMRYRQSTSFFTYRLINFFFKKSHFENFLEKRKIDLIYFVSESYYINYVHSINYIFTLFDLCHRDNPEFPEVRNKRIFEFRERQFQNNLSRAVAVLVESELGKTNVMHRYRLDDERVHIFPIEPAFSIKSNTQYANDTLKDKSIDIKKKYNLKFNYIFYPAQFWAHKNHIYILKALNMLRKEDSILLGAIFSGSDQGNLNYIKEITSKYKLDDNIRFAGFVSNEEMNSLYSQSLALVMPTYFGPTNIPPLEAFKLEVPVLYSDLPGLRDQVKEGALLLDLDDPKSLVFYLKKLISSDKFRKTLIDKGKLRYNDILSNNNNYDVLKKIIKDFRSRRDCWK